MTPEAIRKLYAAYFGMVSLMDHHIGRILDALNERGLAENTLVVFTSDHGDYLGNHGMWGKGLPAYEDMQRVPFIVRHPQCKTAGLHSKALQSLVDMEASFLSIAGLIPRPGSQGVDQTKAWMDANQKARDWVMLEFHPAESSYCQHTFVEDRYKLVLYGNRDYGELYDLHDDPHQLHNLYNEPNYRELLDAIIKRYISAEMDRNSTLRVRTAIA